MKHCTMNRRQGREYRGGYFLEPRRSAKTYYCAECGGVMEAGESYTAVIYPGSGLAGIKFPARCHITCAHAYVDKKMEAVK